MLLLLLLPDTLMSSVRFELLFSFFYLSYHLTTFASLSRGVHFILLLLLSSLGLKDDVSFVRTAQTTGFCWLTHIKNITPNYPEDVLQMFDKVNMTITRAGWAVAVLATVGRWAYIHTRRPIKLYRTGGEKKGKKPDDDDGGCGGRTRS